MAPARGVRVAPILAGVILTLLLLWMLGATADVFLLLFIAIIISLYLGAVRDRFVEKAHLPPKLAFFLSVVGTAAALRAHLTTRHRAACTTDVSGLATTPTGMLSGTAVS